jgi:hypothetical protein
MLASSEPAFSQLFPVSFTDHILPLASLIERQRAAVLVYQFAHNSICPYVIQCTPFVYSSWPAGKHPQVKILQLPVPSRMELQSVQDEAGH